MIAFETNLLVRFVADDNKQQADIAESLMRSEVVFLSRTVMLETEWVLRVHYRKSRIELAAFFGNLLDAENTLIEDIHHVNRALEWYRLGARPLTHPRAGSPSDVAPNDRRDGL